MEGIEAHGDEILSHGQHTEVTQSFGDTKMSRGTMRTDRWRALNADIFDMKLKVQVKASTIAQSPASKVVTGSYNKRLGVIPSINLN